MDGAKEGQMVTFKVTSKEGLRYHLGSLMAAGFMICIFVYGMLLPAPWYYKVMISTALIPVFITYIGFKEFGVFSGKNWVRFTEGGIECSFPRVTWVGEWLENQSKVRRETYVFIPWNDIHRIHCYNNMKEQRNQNKWISPHPQIDISYLDGKVFIFAHSSPLSNSRPPSKLRMIYEELKKEAAQRGIPFTTELESEDCWIGES